MNVLFVFSLQKSIRPSLPLKGQDEIQMGISFISAVLKRAGHQTSLLVLDRNNHNHQRIKDCIQNFNPDVIGFSAVNSEFDYILDVARFIKSKFPQTFRFLGGVHISLNPSEEHLDLFDALCIGEGEYPVLELVQKLQHHEDIKSIANLWVRDNGVVYKNETRSFIEDLDALPFADRQIWQPWILNQASRQVILLGRGCPYNCTYCCNHKLRKISSGKYVRLRSPQNIMAELLEITSLYPDTKEFFFEIETLGTDMEWLQELCERLSQFNQTQYPKLRFSSNLRIFPSIDYHAILKNLQKANFESVIIGLESGNERIRKEVLNRHYSNELMLAVTQAAKAYDIKIGLFNLVGLPTESYLDFQDTLKMNQLIQPAWHATSIFFPYQGTKLYDMVAELGCMPQSISSKHERQVATIEYPSFSKRQIQQCFDRFHFDVYKKNPNKSLVKLFLFYIQIWVGHNFMANTKNRIIKISSYLRVRKSKLFLNIQKM